MSDELTTGSFVIENGVVTGKFTAWSKDWGLPKDKKLSFIVECDMKTASSAELYTWAYRSLVNDLQVQVRACGVQTARELSKSVIKRNAQQMRDGFVDLSKIVDKTCATVGCMSEEGQVDTMNKLLEALTPEAREAFLGMISR
ncbi:MAG: hypothetical protein RR544_02325 [Oscillospiraceae bacterium]